MYRPGTNENDVRVEDVLCDFCHQPWRDDLPIVEGHRGAVICGDCLTLAYRALALHKQGKPDQVCVLCRERRDEPAWSLPAGPAHWETDLNAGLACACLRCVRQAAAVLDKDRDYAWSKPTT